MKNVSTQEIDKFSSLASRWWDLKGEFKSLHDINPLRLAFIQQHADLTNASLADIGCGGGILAEALALEGAEVSAIDMSKTAIETAQLHALDSGVNISYSVTTAEEFAITHTEQFNVVTCMELLEHVPDPCSIIQACSQLLAPGGIAFFSTINRNLKSYLQAIVAAEYVLKLLPAGIHNYQSFIKPSELARSARSAGLTVKASAGLSYNPLNKQYFLTDNLDVNYLLCCEKRK